MNDVKLSLFTAVAFLTVGSFVHGQSLVDFPVGDASWTVAIKQEKPASPPPVAPPNAGNQLHVTQAEVTELNKVKRIRLTWSDGSQSEKWKIPGLPVTFWQDPKNGLVRARQDGGFDDIRDKISQTFDASAFTWITPQCLQEKDPITYMEKQCYHYVGSATLTFPDANVKSILKREAWIDAKTLRPVALDTGDSLSTYTFPDQPPTGKLTPPPAFQKEIAYYKAVMGEQ